MSNKECLQDVLAYASTHLKNKSMGTVESLAAEAEKRLDGVTNTLQKKQILDNLFKETDIRNINAKRAESLMQVFKNNQVARDLEESLKFKTAGKAANMREVLRGVLFGESNDQVFGGDLTPKGIANGYKAPMLEVINKKITMNKDLRTVLESSEADTDILTCIDDLQNGRPFASKNVAAQEIAKVIHEVQNIGAKSLEGKVPFFERIDGYLMRMSWNRDRIVSDRDGFIKFMMDNYGDGTFPHLDPQKRLAAFGEVYNTMTLGAYGRTVSIDPSNPNLSTKLSQLRTLIPNNTRAAIDARAKWGYSVHDTLYRYIDSITADLGIIDKLGPRPVEAIDHALNIANNYVKESGKQFPLETVRKELHGYFSLISGHASEVPIGFFAKALNATMVWARSTLLGYARLASGTDLAQAPLAVAINTGRSQAILTAQIAAGYLKNSLQTPTTHKLNAARLGLTMDMLGNKIQDISYKNSTGWTKTGKWLGNTMNTLNLMENHAAALRNQIADVACMHWGERLGTEFSKLSFQEQNSLKRVGMTPGEWKLVGKYVQQVEYHGEKINVMDLDIIRSIPADDIKAHLKERYTEQVALNKARVEAELPRVMQQAEDKTRLKFLKEEGLPGDLKILIDRAREKAKADYLKKADITVPEITDNLVDEARMDIHNKFAAMIAKMADQGTSTPGVREMYAMHGANSINSGVGQILRILMMFKSASLVNINNYKRGLKLGGKALMDENGQVVGSKSSYRAVAQTALLATTFYMISQYMRDALQGKEPRDPTDPRFLAKSFAAAGFGGIVASSMLDSLAESTGPYAATEALTGALVGPLVAKAGLGAFTGATAAISYGQELAGVKKSDRVKMPTKLALNYVQSSIPLIRLFYTEGLFNYYIADELKNSIYSKYISEKLKAERNQDIMNFEGTKRRGYFMLNPKDNK